MAESLPRQFTLKFVEVGSEKAPESTSRLVYSANPVTKRAGKPLPTTVLGFKRLRQSLAKKIEKKWPVHAHNAQDIALIALQSGHDVHQGYQVFHHKFVSGLMDGQFYQWNEAAQLFSVNLDYKKDSHCRGVKPCAELAALVDEAKTQHYQAWRGGNMVRRAGLRTRDNNGNRNTFSHVKTTVSVNEWGLINHALTILASDDRTPKQAQELDEMERLLDHIQGDTINLVYEQSGSGRIYTKGGSSLQNVSRSVRAIAMAGQWSYDIDNCHFALLKALSNQAMPFVTYYLAHKSAVRKQLASDCQTSEDTIKTVLLAIVYGATLKAGYEIEKATGSAFDAVVNHPIIKGIHGEVRKAGYIVISKHSKGKRGVINPMGKLCKKAAFGERLSHILQGYEAKALEAVTAAYHDDMSLTVHDGWYMTKKVSTGQLERVIFKAIGIRLTVNCERVSAKLNLSLGQLWQGISAISKKLNRRALAFPLRKSLRKSLRKPYPLIIPYPINNISYVSECPCLPTSLFKPTFKACAYSEFSAFDSIFFERIRPLLAPQLRPWSDYFET